MMSIYDENILLKKLKSIIDNEANKNLSIPPHIRRFYRKLSLRQTKRLLSKPVFNIDDAISKKDAKQFECGSNILDRFYHVSKIYLIFCYALFLLRHIY